MMSTVTDTPQFRKWFANSKVVDSAGRPLVVYHGTSKQFRVFDVSRSRKTDIRGVFFATRENFASGFGSPLKCYLRIENPATFDDVYRIASSGGSVSTPKLHTVLKKMGYDGIFDPKRNMAVVFSNKQIKSADKNSGKFSRSNTDIYEDTMGPFESQVEALLSEDSSSSLHW